MSAPAYSIPPRSGLTSLVATAYEAACDSSQIVPFVEETAAYFGAQRSVFFVWPVDKPDVFMPVTCGIKGGEVRRLFDERNEPGSLFWNISRQKPGTTFVCDARMSADRIERAMVGLVDAHEQNRCGLLLLRGPYHDDFSQSVQEGLQTLIDYFRRAIRINRRFIRIFSQNRTAFGLLEHMPIGIAIFGQRGQLTVQNAEARRIFADSRNFRIEHDNLTVIDEESHRRLYDFLQRARENFETELGELRLSLRIPHQDGVAPFQLLAYGLPFTREKAAFDDHESLAVMIIHDPLNLKPLDTQLLQDFFGLTTAEANLARSLHKGLQLNDAAQELKISIHTARTQLRNIFKKAGVNSQAGLVQEFCNSPQLNI